VLILIISSHALNTAILKSIFSFSLLRNFPEVTLYTEKPTTASNISARKQKAAPTSSQIPAPQASSTSQHRTRAKGQII